MPSLSGRTDPVSRVKAAGNASTNSAMVAFTSLLPPTMLPFLKLLHGPHEAPTGTTRAAGHPSPANQVQLSSKCSPAPPDYAGTAELGSCPTDVTRDGRSRRAIRNLPLCWRPNVSESNHCGSLTRWSHDYLPSGMANFHAALECLSRSRMPQRSLPRGSNRFQKPFLPCLSQPAHTEAAY